jgi:hypothetical protein
MRVAYDAAPLIVAALAARTKKARRLVGGFLFRYRIDS